VKTCGAAAAADATDSGAATCKAGYYLGTATPAACVRCPAGFYCPDGTGLAATYKACDAGKTSIDIAAGYAGTSADCSTPSAAVFAGSAAWCQSYIADGSKCVSALPGIITIALGSAGITTTPGGCLTNCKTCTDNTYANCSVAMDGYVKDGVAASTALVSCGTGCATCTAKATPAAGAVDCTAAAAGYSYTAATKAVTICAVGTGNAAANTSATCTACTAASNCRSCNDLAFCTTCAPGFVLDATKGTCTAFAGTTFGTCLKANAATASDCQSCDDT